MVSSWDAIVINFNGEIFLDPCLRALFGQTHPPARTIVVDNASTDESIKELAGWPEVEVVQCETNLGFAGGANRGADTSDAPVMVFLNPDVELQREFGAALLSLFADQSSLGVAGAKLLFPDSDVIQHAGGIVHWPQLTTAHFAEGEPDLGQADDPRQADYVTGAAMSVRRDAFDAVRGFDSRYFPAYWEDVDLCYRVHSAGWGVEYRPELRGVHHEGSGARRDSSYFRMWSRNRLRFAVHHLTSTEWWQEFVPAEIERLRGEISAIESSEWLTTSGGASIELLARAAGLPSHEVKDVSRPEPLVDAIKSFRTLPVLADPAPGPITPADGILRRMKRFLSRFSGRLYAEELYWQQRQFNEAVVRSLEAQDRLNRELSAQILFTLLLVGQARYVDMPSTCQSDESS